MSKCGHTVVTQGNRARCITCGQSWYGSNKHQVDMILILGRCPGPRIWGIPPYRELDDRPIVIPQRGPPIVYNGKLLDRSHKLRWYKGLLYCGCCGSSSVNRVKGLKDPCKLKSPTVNMTRRLNSIRSGKPPYPLTTWPNTNAMYPWDE